MAISVDWPTRVINIPKADTILVQSSPEIRTLDMDTFRRALRSLEDDEDGMPFDITHLHNPPFFVGSNLEPRAVVIINGYTVTFEAGLYSVNAINGKTNLRDVQNYNGVSLGTDNTGSIPALSSEYQNILNSLDYRIAELHKLSGLDVGDPAFIPAGEGTLTAGSDISIDVTGDCDTGHTLTRQP